MALYQFCAKRKNGQFHRVKHILGEAKHDLQILDLISMQFNTKEELMEFLGLDLSEFDDIAITYQSNGEPRKIDVILADAPELEDILYSMVDFGSLEEYGCMLTMLSLAYTHPNLVNTTNEINRDSWGFNRIRQKLMSDPYRIENAFDVGLLHRRAYDFYERSQDEFFINEITKSYLTIRKLYSYLRIRGYIKPNMETKPKAAGKLSEIIEEIASVNDNDLYNKLISTLIKIPTNDYEDALISRILKGDSEALDQFMQFDINSLEKFRVFLAILPEYLEMLRKQRKNLE